MTAHVRTIPAWRPLCYEPDELASWDGSRPCADCLPAFHRARLAEGTCNGAPNLPGKRGPGKMAGGRPVSSNSARAVKRRALKDGVTISFW
jgi:hypothetical protein